ncbi:MAG: hypothetical protein OEW24_10095, partial [Chloroflexota bacterium]|nr:hypothetical protein [Chloroflexota bacterium]
MPVDRAGLMTGLMARLKRWAWTHPSLAASMRPTPTGFRDQDEKKAYWLRPLRRDAFSLLTAEFDHPVLSTRRTMSALDLNR